MRTHDRVSGGIEIRFPSEDLYPDVLLTEILAAALQQHRANVQQKLGELRRPNKVWRGKDSLNECEVGFFLQLEHAL
jgi:hypothetical protein